MIKNTNTEYGSIAKSFHWLIVFMVLGLVIVGLNMEGIEDKATKLLVFTVHKSFGLTLLTVMIFRVVWTLSNVRPELLGTTLERIAAWSMHFSLYILLFAMPLTGWIMSTAADHAPNVFGLFTLPLPGIPIYKPLGKFFGWLHFLFAWTLITLVILHIAAAFKHYWIDKDDVLRRMMPGRLLRRE